MDPQRDLLRHAVATLAYRGGKAVRDVAPGFSEFSAGNGVRSPGQLLAHVGDLLDWALSLAKGAQAWTPIPPAGWEKDVARFHEALKQLDDFLASDAPLGAPSEQLIQGPIADSLAHVGQIIMLRRLAGGVMRSENYARADVVVGRVGTQQTAPKREFD
jgi:hypothetical protein